jgi:hypothetical protein
MKWAFVKLILPQGAGVLKNWVMLRRGFAKVLHKKQTVAISHGRRRADDEVSAGYPPPSWPGFVPAIHVFDISQRDQDVDARHKAGHDESEG